ncbi:MAG: DNRLRE domain-containing protein [Chloroflexota bacterium]|nr:DNRLRE domain-containing protein [Chloroflexota bacterium]
MLLMMVAPVAVVGGPETAATSSRTFVAAADARVEEAFPKRNFGAAPQLRVDGGGGPDARTYLRFQVKGMTDRVTRATLRLYVTEGGGTTDGPRVYRARNDWRETSITWAKQPQRVAGPYDNANALVEGSSTLFDVTTAGRGDGSYTFVLAPQSGDGVHFQSREALNRPQLVVTAGGEDDGTETVTVVAAGDVACEPTSGYFNGGRGTGSAFAQGRTADLVEQINPDLVLGLGDMQYEAGTLAAYEASYDPSWGRFKEKTLVVAGGSHDFYGGGDFYAYWGERAGPAPLRNWFSREAGAWHLVFLNSYCSNEVGGCGPGSVQYEWLKADLAASNAACALALWHEPRYSSGSSHGSDAAVDPLWDLLYARGTELALTGHDHDYERFAPLDGGGNVDPTRGLRQFIVGTGGKSHYPFGTILAASEARNADTFGVLKLTLRAGGYTWAFVPEAGKTYSDVGSGTCF